MTIRRKKMLLLSSIGAIAFGGLCTVLSGCGTLRMGFVDFPINKLQPLDTSTTLSTQPSSGETKATVDSTQITGEGACTLRSSMTKIAGRFLPGTTFVDVLINGTKATLVVDTGCRRTAVFPTFAERARVPISKAPIGTWEKTDGQGSTPFYQGLATNLVLGNFTISNCPVLVLGKQHEVRILGVPVYHMDGLLGMDILQNFAITFVLSDGSVRFSRRLPSLAPHAKRLPFRLSKTCMISQATVNGKPTGDCLMDTGSSGTLVLTEATWNKLALGETQARVNLQMGDINMNNVPAEKSDAVGMGMVPMNILATKGTKTITIDFQAEEIVFE